MAFFGKTYFEAHFESQNQAS